jgi:hypothetical protein
MVLRKLGALSPEMWGKRMLRTSPAGLRVASYFLSRNERASWGEKAVF